MQKILGVIPARYASTRFPGKPLVLIDGMPMIERVYKQAILSNALYQVIVATDDSRIYECVVGFGGKAMLTSALHNSGTDRCAEVALHYNQFDIVVNIQGDEPYIDPQQIDDVCKCFENPEVQIATLIKPILNQEEVNNANVVKCVVSNSYKALYFSRSVIPFQRQGQASYFKHIGIYAYQNNVLQALAQLPASALEQTEALEQLRWIQNDYYIQTAVTTIETIAIDTPADLKKLGI
ncbi:MAG TPA: 3-deoxy-manno-octulosonate cytidylyltransferase [Bacteroidia bacterium]|nr:3-deoxy-manno-octulosonate cytidylyltransferase [Bacteroidia bacterium]